MPLDCAVVGAAAGERTVDVSVRACLAYAAGTSDPNPQYIDDDRPAGIVAPPLFGVSLDWALRPALTGLLGLTTAESARGVHATHDMIFHRPIRPRDRLTVRGTVVQAEPRPPGAYLVCRYDTTDPDGAPVLTVYYGSIFRGVQTTGTPTTLAAPPPLPPRPDGGSHGWAVSVQVPRLAPHIYTECADIYNPIHTERAAALAAGLPDIIVHGTLTLAYAVRELVNRDANGDPRRLRRVACRFGGMVIPGERIAIRSTGSFHGADGVTVGFAVEAANGAAAIRDGVALLADA